MYSILLILSYAIKGTLKLKFSNLGRIDNFCTLHKLKALTKYV